MLPAYTVTTTVYTCCGDGGGVLGGSDGEPTLWSLLPDEDGGGEGRTSKAAITLMAAGTIELLFAQLAAEVIAARSCAMVPMFVPR